MWNHADSESSTERIVRFTTFAEVTLVHYRRVRYRIRAFVEALPEAFEQWEAAR